MKEVREHRGKETKCKMRERLKSRARDKENTCRGGRTPHRYGVNNVLTLKINCLVSVPSLLFDRQAFESIIHLFFGSDFVNSSSCLLRCLLSCRCVNS